MSSQIENPKVQIKQRMNSNEYKVKVLNKGLRSERKFPMPDVKSVMPYERNPFDLKHQDHLLELTNWYYQYSGMTAKKYDKAVGSGLFTAFIFPFCTDIKRYDMVFLILLGLFTIDDVTETEHGDSKDKFIKCIKVWQELLVAMDRLVSDEYIPMTYWNPIVMCMHAIHERICTDFNDIQKQRLVTVWKEYIEGNIEEIEFIRDNRKFKSIHEFLEMRKKSVGKIPCTQLIEYTDNIRLTETEWNDPDLQQWLNMCTIDLIYLNDIYSFEKEYNAMNGDMGAMFNTVAVIAILDNCSVSVAMDELVAMIGKQENDIQVLTQKITSKSECRPEVKTFIEKAGYVVGANVGCSPLMDRYNHFE